MLKRLIAHQILKEKTKTSASLHLRDMKTTIAKTKSDLKNQGLEENNAVLKFSFVNLESRRKNSSYGSWGMLFFSFVPLIAVAYAAFFAAPPPPPKPVEPSSKGAAVSSSPSINRSARG